MILICLENENSLNVNKLILNLNQINHIVVRNVFGGPKLVTRLEKQQKSMEHIRTTFFMMVMDQIESMIFISCL